MYVNNNTQNQARLPSAYSTQLRTRPPTTPPRWHGVWHTISTGAAQKQTPSPAGKSSPASGAQEQGGEAVLSRPCPSRAATTLLPSGCSHEGLGPITEQRDRVSHGPRG